MDGWMKGRGERWAGEEMKAKMCEEKQYGCE